MKCPVCKDVTLLMAEKNGVEIDYCPECRGIWLDRGELEKIIERAVKYESEPYKNSGYADRSSLGRETYDREKYRDSKNSYGSGQKKKKEELPRGSDGHVRRRRRLKKTVRTTRAKEKSAGNTTAESSRRG